MSNRSLCRSLLTLLVATLLVYAGYFAATLFSNRSRRTIRLVFDGEQTQLVSEWRSQSPMILQLKPIESAKRPARPSRPACVSEVSLTSTCKGVGFGGMLLSAVDVMTVCDRLGLPVVVRWTGCWPYCGPTDGTNYWLSFFESTYDLDKDYLAANGALCIGDELLDREYSGPDIVNYAFRPSEEDPSQHRDDAPQNITNSVRRSVNRIIKKYLKPRPEIQKQVDNFVEKFFTGRTVIGVHVRQTDRAGEMRIHRKIETEAWLHLTQHLLEKVQHSHNSASYPHPAERQQHIVLYVASDNTEAVDAFIAHFSKWRRVVVVKSDAWRTAETDAEFWNVGMSSANGIAAARGVLIDILLLSRCEYLLHGESSIAALASYFNPMLRLSYASVSEAVSWSESRNRAKGTSDRRTGSVSFGPLDHFSVRLSALQAEKDGSDESIDEGLEQELECLRENGPHSICYSNGIRYIAREDVNSTLSTICNHYCRANDTLEKIYEAHKSWSL